MPAGDSLPLTDVAVVADLKKMPNGYDAVSYNQTKYMHSNWSQYYRSVFIMIALC